MQFLKGNNEIIKVCSGEKSSEEKTDMICSFFRCMLKTPKFAIYTNLKMSPTLFVISEATEFVIIEKGLPKSDMILRQNITYSLHAVRLVNVVYNRILEMKNEQISQSNDMHVALLESLWMNMKPNLGRSNNTIISPDWMILGFQGSDPTTDFRSLGLLGLYQLVYFSLHRTPRAHMVLAEMSKPGKYYPFAVIGINISQFIMELFNENRLHRIIFDNYRNIIMACSSIVRESPSDDVNCINYCSETIHDLYCLVFEEFYMLWVIRNPESIMSFADLFTELKQNIRSKYPVV